MGCLGNKIDNDNYVEKRREQNKNIRNEESQKKSNSNMPKENGEKKYEERVVKKEELRIKMK